MHIFVQWTNATLSLSTLNQISSREKKKKRKIKKRAMAVLPGTRRL